MPSMQNLTFVFVLLTLLISIASANPLLAKEKERARVGDVDQLLQLLDQIDPPALHAALHDFSPKKFKHGVFQEDRTAVKAVHRIDAAAATSIISLAKRLGSADNSSSTAPAPVGPATATTETTSAAGIIGSTTTVIASTPPTTVLVTSTLPPSSAGASSSASAGTPSSSAAAGGVSASSGASSPGSTQASSSGGTLATGSLITSTNAAGVTMVSTVGGGAATFGSVVTSTDARGLTIVSTIGGSVVTIQPSGSQGSTPSSAAASQSTAAGASHASSAATQSSHTSVFLQTTSIPGVGQSTITAVTVVAGPPAATPSGSAGAKTGSTTSASPGLQSGGAVASRMVGWEMAGLLGGAIGVAMVL